MIWAPTTGVAPSRQLVKGPRSRRSVRRLPAALFWSTGLAARRVFDSFLSAGHDNWRNIGPSTGQRCCLARLAPLHAVLAPCRASPRSSTGVRACRPLRPLPSRSLRAPSFPPPPPPSSFLLLSPFCPLLPLVPLAPSLLSLLSLLLRGLPLRSTPLLPSQSDEARALPQQRPTRRARSPRSPRPRESPRAPRVPRIPRCCRPRFFAHVLTEAGWGGTARRSQPVADRRRSGVSPLCDRPPRAGVAMQSGPEHTAANGRPRPADLDERARPPPPVRPWWEPSTGPRASWRGRASSPVPAQASRPRDTYRFPRKMAAGDGTAECQSALSPSGSSSRAVVADTSCFVMSSRLRSQGSQSAAGVGVGTA